MTKKTLIIAIIIFLIIDLIAFVVIKNRKTQSAKSTQMAATKKKKSGDFMWGVMIRPNELIEYDEKSQEKYWQYLDELGVNWVRMQYTPPDLLTFEKNLQKAREKGLKTMAIIPPEIGKKESSKTPDPAAVEEKTKEFAQKYAGQIPYYQIASELGNFVLKDPLYAGIKESDYESKKYQSVLSWVRAMTSGIRKGDPKAKILLSINRTHFGILDKFVKDKVDFDAIGISWYSGYGENLSDMFSGDPEHPHFNVIEKAESYHKTIIFTEVTQRFGSKMKGKEGGIEQQADFLVNFFEQVKNYKSIKGVFVYEFLDGITPPGFANLDDEAHYGLISHTRTEANWTLDALKKAFYTYAEIIKKN